jgi:hypothetical protein
MVNAAWIIYGALSTIRMATVNDFPLGWAGALLLLLGICPTRHLGDSGTPKATRRIPKAER